MSGHVVSPGMLAEKKSAALTLSRAWYLLSPWWFSTEKRLAWVGFGFLVLLSVFSVWLRVWLNVWSRDFYQAIGSKNMQHFMHEVLIFLPLVVLIIAEFCTRAYLAAWLSFRWRRWVTDQFESHWLFTNSYCLLPLTQKELDNPDQRISQDTREMCYGCLNLVLNLFREGVNFVTFYVVLWSITQGLHFSMGGHTVDLSVVLIGVAIVYSSVMTMVTLRIGRPLFFLNIAQEKLEADFRYQLMRVREHHNEISLLRGETFEKQGLRHAFFDLTKNYYHILTTSIYLNVFQNFYANASLFVPLVLAGPLYFAGTITLGVLMQIRDVFLNINSSLAIIAFSYADIVSWLAAVKRLSFFSDNMQDAQSCMPQRTAVKEGTAMSTRDLILYTPTQTVMWAVPDTTIPVGARCICQAPSGCGKSTLLRTFAQLYPYYTGIAHMSAHNVLILPQRPYMPQGTLQACLTYPFAIDTIAEEKIIYWLTKLHLPHLIERLYQTGEYTNQLSSGEQQRVCLIRALLHQPIWLLMDEPVAHLSTEMAAMCLQQLIIALPQTTMVLITHQDVPSFQPTMTLHAC